jgi:hypothetical protein
MLIVLDNARDEAQVRPLLPADPGSMVLVTIRCQLAGLAARDGAHLISLDLLAEQEAHELLTARPGAARAALNHYSKYLWAQVGSNHRPLACKSKSYRRGTSPGVA